MPGENKRNYYAIIPANIRYDVNLTANAKLMYGEITALSNEKGYCWASNEYFADLYSVSKKTVSLWIKQLKENNYIETQINYKEGSKEIESRYIQICVYPMEKNFPTPSPKKVIDNNKSFNIKNNTIAIDDFFEILWKEYPKKKGKGDIKKTQKKELYKIGLEEMLRAINRYKTEIVDKDNQYVKNGGTFFNSGYVDYLDCNYEEMKKSERPKSIYREL